MQIAPVYTQALIRPRFFLFYSSRALWYVWWTHSCCFTPPDHLTVSKHNDQPSLFSSRYIWLVYHSNPGKSEVRTTIPISQIHSFRKALALVWFSSASIYTIQLEPLFQGCCSGSTAGCYSHPLQTNAYTCCPVPTHFLFWVGSQITSTSHLV